MRRDALIAIAALGIGLLARGELLSLAPRYGFLGDHVDYVCWGRQARTRGVLDLYATPPSTCPAVVYADGAPGLVATGSRQRLNYPPLAAYLFWAQGSLLAALDEAQHANTLASRTVYAVSTTLAELATAVAGAALVRIVAGRAAATAAFALIFLTPPLLLDGAFWGQTESWVLAPGLWMVVAMARERWLLAGALWGVALALKPSGVLFGPLWLYALFFRRARIRIALGGLAAAAVVNLVALPFWLDSGPSWLNATYLGNYVYDLHWTTMMAFNVWYVDLLLTERLDSRALLFGVSRDAWGTALLALGIAGSFVLARSWERRNPARQALGVLPAATLLTLAAVMLPTRVHSTYGAFTAPFLICTAFLVPYTAPGTVAMTVAVSLWMLSWQWGSLLAVHVLPNEQSFPPARQAARRAMREHDRPREWALTLTSLAAAAAVAAGVAARPARSVGADET